MKRLKFVVALIFWGFFTSAYSMMSSQPQDANPVQRDVQRIRQILSDHINQNNDIINYSTGKDVVLFIGNTGVGKSSLIAYLSGMPLTFDGEDISLVNPGGEKIAIGDGSNSVTTLPVPVSLPNTNLVFYDLPGLRDSRGLPYDLLTAAFIKNIAEHASSLRFIFVESYSSITEGARGELFKSILEKAKQVFDVNSSSSIFLVTRTPPEIRPNKAEQINQLIREISEDQFIGDNGNLFLERKRGIEITEKEKILNAILALQGTQYHSIQRPLDVSSLYSAEGQLRLRAISEDSKQRAFGIFDQAIPKFNNSTQALNYHNNRIPTLQAFQARIDADPEIQLLKNIISNNNIFNTQAWMGEAQRQIEDRTEIVNQRYRGLLREEEARRAEEQERKKRIEAQEKQRALQLQIEREQWENDPSNWPTRTEIRNIGTREVDLGWKRTGCECLRKPGLFTESRYKITETQTIQTITMQEKMIIAEHQDGRQKILSRTRLPDITQERTNTSSRVQRGTN